MASTFHLCTAGRPAPGIGADLFLQFDNQNRLTSLSCTNRDTRSYRGYAKLTNGQEVTRTFGPGVTDVNFPPNSGVTIANETTEEGEPVTRPVGFERWEFGLA